MEKEPVRILVIGASGNIGDALVRKIAMGGMLGPDQPVILHMLDIPCAAEALNGVKMELEDAAFPHLKGVVASTDVAEGCTWVNIAFMVVGFSKEGMEGKEVMSALQKHAAANCKILVVANLTDTHALILKEFEPSIPKKKQTVLIGQDYNVVFGPIAEELNIQGSDVKNAFIWKHHSSTPYPDVNHPTVKTPSGEKAVCELVADNPWLDGDFGATVQQCAAETIKNGTLSSALFVASSACDRMRDWVLGTPEGTWISMGVYSDGSHNVPAGLIYSFPVTCRNGEWKIVQGLSIDELSWKKCLQTMILGMILIFLFIIYSLMRGTLY